MFITYAYEHVPFFLFLFLDLYAFDTQNVPFFKYVHKIYSMSIKLDQDFLVFLLCNGSYKTMVHRLDFEC